MSRVGVPDGSDLWLDPSPTLPLCFQTKTTGSGIWFERTKVWSEVTSIWGWSGQRSLTSGDGLIRSHFWIIMAWSEVISVWVSVIRGGFKRSLVWSEKILSAIGSDLRPFRTHFFLANRQQKNNILIRDTSRVWWLWSETKWSSW